MKDKFNTKSYSSQNNNSSWQQFWLVSHSRQTKRNPKLEVIKHFACYPTLLLNTAVSSEQQYHKVIHSVKRRTTLQQ